MTKPREGYKYITALPEGEACVGMVTHKGTMMVATTRGVYHLEDDELIPVRFEVPTEEPQK